jgi:hypothetical protein
MWKYFYIITKNLHNTLTDKDVSFIEDHVKATKDLLEEGYRLHTQLEGKHFTAYYFYKEVK